MNTVATQNQQVLIVLPPSLRSALERADRADYPMEFYDWIDDCECSSEDFRWAVDNGLMTASTAAPARRDL